MVENCELIELKLFKILLCLLTYKLQNRDILRERNRNSNDDLDELETLLKFRIFLLLFYIYRSCFCEI